MKNKAIFGQLRETIGNHADKAIIRYYQAQGADKAQIEQIKGNQQRWK